MLHKDPFVIAPETFKLIQELQAIPELSDFNLVGGTTLALLLGHRNSIDIDLFTTNNFSDVELKEVLSNSYSVQQIFSKKNALLTNINNIKVDFISHPYPIIKPIISEEGIRMLSMEDICAMKLHAITNSGQRLKDFIDIYFLLEHFSMRQMLDFYEAKYPLMNSVIALRAITFFDDIDPDIDPPKMLKPISIDKIKKRITDAVISSNKTFR
jgi:Nucleotidyl transferase AbiEii toxin, Type IV TA system